MTFPHKINDKHWIQVTSTILKGSRMQAGRFRFTQPTPESGGVQSPFYSALHAIVLRWFDADMAADELTSASAHQEQVGANAGRMPAYIAWRDPSGSPRADDTQVAPPLLGYATVQVYHLTGDYNLLQRMAPRLADWHDWIDRVRDPHKTQLAQVAASELADLNAFPSAAMLAFNALRAADLDSVAHVFYDLGDKIGQAEWETRAEAVKQAVSAAAQGGDHDPMTRRLLGFAGILSDAEIEALGEEAPRSNMVENWFAFMTLRRHQKAAAATRLAERCFRMLESSGFYSTYDPETGQGSGVSAPAFSALAIEMFCRERQGIPKGGQCI